MSEKKLVHLIITGQIEGDDKEDREKLYEELLEDVRKLCRKYNLEPKGVAYMGGS